jgi:hypothetical protein
VIEGDYTMTCSYYGEKYTVNTLNTIDCVAPSCSEEEFMALQEFMALSKADAAAMGDFYGMDCTIRAFSGLETPSNLVIVLLAAACCTTLLLN